MVTRPLAALAAVAAAALSSVLIAPTAHAATRYAELVAPVAVCANGDTLAGAPAQKRRSMACFVNFARAQQGLKPLRLQVQLNTAAALKLAANARCDVFSHTPCALPFASVFSRSGYLRPATAVTVGENLAWGRGARGTPRQIMIGWLNSTTHRRNLLDPRWAEMGLAQRRDSEFAGHGNVALWANSFGIRSRA